MTETNETTDAQTGDPANTDAAPDAATQLEQAVEKEYRTLDDLELSPKQLAVVDAKMKSERSAAVNNYIEQKKTSGDGATMADINAALEKRDQEHAAKDKARSEMEHTLFTEHGIAVGSQDYRDFSAASAAFKPENLRKPEGIALIVKAAGIKTAKDAHDAATTGVDALYTPKAYDGTDLAGIPPTGISLSDLDKTD